MAKTKNNKGVSSNPHHPKKYPKKVNPFELHINKEKLSFIGKKQKNDRGLPGSSRAKAIQKRKNTLLEEYEVKNKNNMFVDKRIGEKVNMDNEEKAIARFTALKMKSHNKKNIFNLADDEVLTHKGQTLSQIENFDDPRSDDDFSDTENKSGYLDTSFVKEAHFGGGILKNTRKEGAMTHKDLINQLIIESKKGKAEKQKAKETTLELTEKLDSDWKVLIPFVINDVQNKEELKKQKIEDYDKVMRELRFEKRGTVSDRLKSEKEIAQDEKEYLANLEQDRIKRMNEYVNEDPLQPKHRSADDLDDGFVYDSNENHDIKMLSYNQDGQSNFQVAANVKGIIIRAKGDTSNHEQAEQVEEEQDDEKSSDEELETDSEDNLSDLKESDIESEEENLEQNEEKEKSLQNDKRDEEKSQNNKEHDENSKNENPENSKMVLSDQSKIKSSLSMKSANINKNITVCKNKEPAIQEITRGKYLSENQNIPFTFKLPNSYEELLQTLKEYEQEQHVVIERMIKCNHPSLSEQNKENLGVLFAYLLQYLNDLFSENLKPAAIKKHFKIFQLLVPQIYALAQLNSLSAHSCMRELFIEKFDEYRKKPKTSPGLEVAVFFKLVSALFPTSDFRHEVVTPCYIFMEKILTKCRMQTKRDISYGLFVSSLILEYSALSKRYLPAVINYLSGLLHMAIPKSGVKLIKISLPFKSTSTLLVLQKNYSLDPLNSLKLHSTDFCQDEISPDYQIRVLHNIVRMLQGFLEHYKQFPSHIEIFEVVLDYLQMIPLIYYPKEIQNNARSFIEELKKNKDERKLVYLIWEASKPKALRLYEPKIQVVYDGKQHKVQSKEKAQLNKLLHKVKREKKGAIREIRRDNTFLGRVKINKQLQSDNDRREKVKRIYSEAAVQQSELNAIDRKKKRKV